MHHHLHPPREGGEDEAAEGGALVHQPQEERARDDHGGEIGRGDGLAGIVLAAHEAERRLHAALAGLDRVEQDLAPGGAGEEHLDAALENDHEALRRIPRTEEERAPGEPDRAQRLEPGARVGGKIGQARVVDPAHGGSS